MKRLPSTEELDLRMQEVRLLRKLIDVKERIINLTFKERGQ